MKKIPASQKAYKNIEKMIINRELLPGNPIDEVYFARKFNMSRTPIRTAINRLQDDGLVELISNKGAYVKNLSKSEIILSYEIIEALEGMAVYLVAEKYKLGVLLKSNLDNLKKLVIKMDKYLETKNYNDWSICDGEFHGEITKLCGNYYLQNEYSRLKIQMNCVLWFITPMYIDKRTSNKEHYMILESILEKEPDKARQIAQKHRNRVRNEIHHLL